MYPLSPDILFRRSQVVLRERNTGEFRRDLRLTVEEEPALGIFKVVLDQVCLILTYLESKFSERGKCGERALKI